MHNLLSGQLQRLDGGAPQLCDLSHLQPEPCVDVGGVHGGDVVAVGHQGRVALREVLEELVAALVGDWKPTTQMYRTSLRLGRALVSTFVFFCKIYGWQSVCGH